MTSLTALDSSSLIAILQGEPEASKFLDVVTSGNLIVGTPTLLEVRIWCLRRRDRASHQWLDEFREAVQVAAFEAELERIAASAYQRFGRGMHPASLNYGDAMAYAVAARHGAPLLFKGSDFGRTDVQVHPASVLLD